MKPRPPPAVRRQLITLLLVTAGLALVGGALLVAAPDGHLLRLSPALLVPTPFANYLIPGLVLGLGVGGAQLAAGLALARSHPRGLKLGTMAGLILAGWITIQELMIGGLMWLQPVFFGVGVVELMMVASNMPRASTRKRRFGAR
jgi:hypothetical protein